MSDSATPLPDARPLDLANDRFVLVLAASFGSLMRRDRIIKPIHSLAVHRIGEDAAEGVYPREGFFGLFPDVCFGTVEEIIDEFRRRLSRALQNAISNNSSTHRANEELQAAYKKDGLDRAVNTGDDPELVAKLVVHREDEFCQKIQAKRDVVEKDVHPSDLSPQIKARMEDLDSVETMGQPLYRVAEYMLTYLEEKQTRASGDRRIKLERTVADDDVTGIERKLAQFKLDHPKTPDSYARAVTDRVAALVAEFLLVYTPPKGVEEVLADFLAHCQTRGKFEPVRQL